MLLETFVHKNSLALHRLCSGVRKILELMDWQSGSGEAFEGIVPNYVRFGEVSAEAVDAEVADGLAPDDVFLVISPQNIVGYSIIPLLGEMIEAAAGRPLIIFNPNFKDIQSSEGKMSVRGRGERLEFEASFKTIYNYRTLYPSASKYFPIVGAICKAGPREPYVAYERQESRVTAGTMLSPDDREGDDVRGFTNVGGVALEELYIPRGSYDDLPSDPVALSLLEKCGAKW